MANYPDTVKKIQIKDSSGKFLFPRVRTADVTIATTSTAVFDANDKLKIDYLPTKNSIGPAEGAGAATNSYVATEKAVRDAISSIEAGLAGTVNSVSASAGDAVWASPTSGAVVVGVSSAAGNASTKGAVATKDVAAANLDTTKAALNLTAITTSGGTWIVPTWNVFRNATDKLVSMINTASSNPAGKHAHDSTASNGVYLSNNNGTWYAKADLATRTTAGTVKLFNSTVFYDNTAHSGRVIDLETLDEYYGVPTVKAIYATSAQLADNPTTGESTSGDLVLVASGAARGVYYRVTTGTSFSKVLYTYNVVVHANDVNGEIYVDTGAELGYQPIYQTIGSVKSIANTASTTAAAATTAANNASTAAATATTKANNASTAAATATTTANAASTAAATATTTANAASTTAAGAVTTANTASTTAVNASKLASTASATAATASTTAAAATTAANAASTAAATATTTANAASTAAATATTKANNASTAAATATTTANTASTTAAGAVTTANTASSLAASVATSCLYYTDI